MIDKLGRKNGYWEGKKRPDLKNTKSAETMFQKGFTPWNKGIKGFMVGENNGNWKGGKYIDGKYMRIDKDGKHYWEHRYLMEQYLGRKLKSNEKVHHINCDPLDNRIENLQLMTASEHSKLHMTHERAVIQGHACKGIPKKYGKNN